ncbi:MAG: TIGR03663 family protein [Gemmatimonadota bacterium]|nr:MAG: TIGR03663 family protein [Gemmatimonadota bacterium]
MRTKTLVWFNVCFICALFLRLFLFDLKPLHSDEGVHAWNLVTLYRTGVYLYDPTMHHGPFLSYLGLVPFYLLGINTFSLRFFPALCNSGLLLLLIPLRRRIGEAGVVAAGIVLALSPINVYYSREIIHESYFIFFTLTAIVFASRYLENRKLWLVIGFGASLAFLWTIKETLIITLAAWTAALTGTVIIGIFSVDGGMRKARLRETLASIWAEARGLRSVLIFCFFLILAIGVLLYSSFFTNWHGVDGFFSGVRIWASQGIAGQGHQKPFFYYLELMIRFELPVLLFGLVGMYYSFRRSTRFSIFISLWALFIFGAYSIIPYKTPWLLMNIVLPFALSAGYAANEILNSLVRRRGLLIFAVDIAIIMTCFLGYHSIRVSFFDYDNDTHPLTYVQTKRDIKKLVSRIEQVSGALPEGTGVEIKVLSPDYWPLPWYLRDYSSVGYFSRIIDDADAPVIIGSPAQQKDLESMLEEKYHIENYELRQGVRLDLYIRNDAWEKCCAFPDRGNDP